MHTRPKAVILTLIAALALAVLLPINRAAAQGTLGALPDPISSRDLNDYAQRLGLSDQQLLAISEPHAQYLERFRDLREREIEAFIDQFRGFRGMRRFDPSVFGQLEPVVREFNRLTSRIRTLDEQFFGDIHAILTPEQAEMMPRIRQQRERLRYRSEATRFVDFINPSVRVDLSQMVLQLDLPPAEMDAIDAILAQYESRLTNTSRRVFDSAVKMVTDGLKELQQLGIDEDIMSNPGEVMRVFNAAQEIWEEVTADLHKEAAQLTQLNRSTFRQLSQMLPEDSARMLRDRFYSRAYPEAAAIGRSAESHFIAALEMEAVPDDLAQSIAAMMASHMQGQDRLANQVADLLDQWRRNPTLMQTVRRGDDPARSQINELTERARAADEAAIETLKAMLGPDLADRLRPASPEARRSARMAEGRGGRMGAGPAGRAGMRGPGRRGAGGPFGGSIDFLTESRPADRISSADLRDYAQRLNLNGTATMLLESLHEDYIEGFETIRREYAAPYARIVEELRNLDRDAPPAETARKVEEGFALLEAMLHAVDELDSRFFNDVRVAVIDSNIEQQALALDALRSARERARYTVPSAANMPFGFRGGNEAGVDVARILASLELDENTASTVVPVIAEYEREASDLFRGRFQTEMAIHRSTLRFAAARAEGISGREAREQFRQMGERMAEVRQTARTASNALADLNRETLDDLLANLPDAAAAQLLDRYNREAFPAAFDDPDSAESFITSALRLDNLAEGQRSRILEIAADYRPQYSQITYRILEHHQELAQNAPAGGPIIRGASGAAGGPGGGGWGGRMERMAELDMLSFDRTELNERTIRQLRAILSPDQVAQLQ